MSDEAADPSRLRRLEHRVPRARGRRLGGAREPRLLPRVRAARRGARARAVPAPARAQVARAGRAARGTARARCGLRARLHDGASRRGRLRRARPRHAARERRAPRARSTAARAARASRPRTSRGCRRVADGVALEDGSFDAVHCLEVAFHFGAKGRRDFLAESYRVLRPGGRLVLVDFVWRDAQPGGDRARSIRSGWCATPGASREFEPLERYRATRRGARLPRARAPRLDRAGDQPLPAHRADQRARRHVRGSGAWCCARSGPATRGSAPRTGSSWSS